MTFSKPIYNATFTISSTAMSSELAVKASKVTDHNVFNHFVTRQQCSRMKIATLAITVVKL